MGTKYKGSKKDEKLLDAYIRFSRAATSIENQLSRYLIENGLTFSQFSVLEVLLHLGPMNQKDVAEKIFSSNSNLVTVIDNLENAGMVRRERSAKDRRNFIVHLTSKGEKLINELFPKHLKLISERFNVLNDKELETLGRLSKKIGLNVDE